MKPGVLNATFQAAAADFKAGRITYTEFSLIYINLFFEAYLRYSGDESRSVDRKVVEALEAFADPSGDSVDGKGELREDVQRQLLDFIE